jgi:hypothetical protein
MVSILKFAQVREFPMHFLFGVHLESGFIHDQTTFCRQRRCLQDVQRQEREAVRKNILNRIIFSPYNALESYIAINSIV